MSDKIKLSTLKANPGNPRRISEAKMDALKKSLSGFEQMMALRPIVVDETWTVLGGNMRLQALKQLGHKEIPREWVKIATDLTEEQKREFIIKDNVGFGEWDWDVLANEWDAEQLGEWGLDAFADGGSAAKDPFNDEGVTVQNKYGVIVMCESEAEQAHIFDRLSGEGLTCKIVVV
jgi:hypothetical protein